MTRNQFTVIKVSYILSVAIIVFYVGYNVLQNGFSPKQLRPHSLTIVIFLAIFLISSSFIHRMLKNKVRSTELKSKAKEQGWKYNDLLELPLLEVMVKELKLKWQILPNPLLSGYSDGITGKINGWDFVIFDGVYHIGDGENTTLTMFALDMDDVELPLFGLEPETFAHKFANLIKKSDIDFYSHPKFSKNYTLYGENKDHIRQLFKTEVLDFFESIKGISVFGYKNHVIMCRRDKLCRPALLENELNFLVEIAKLFLRNNKIEKQTIKPFENPPSKGNVQYW
jgi:hypothetical protein